MQQAGSQPSGEAQDLQGLAAGSLLSCIPQGRLRATCSSGALLQARTVCGKELRHMHKPGEPQQLWRRREENILPPTHTSALT